jgi:hypothetical protein
VIKKDELENPKSCWNKAEDTEIVFVLLERDVAAPAAIREWVRERIRLNKNKIDDPQIREALSAADMIERSQTY